MAVELGPDGRFRRLVPPVLEALLQDRPRTGDREVDRLLQVAEDKFLSPRQGLRAEALEALWDAFERAKTLLPGAKKVAAEAMVDAAATHPDLRARLHDEARELTSVGNRHLVRHKETDQVPLETDAQLDYLFARLWAFLALVAPRVS